MVKPIEIRKSLVGYKAATLYITAPLIGHLNQLIKMKLFFRSLFQE